jgi:hypothetical protein
LIGDKGASRRRNFPIDRALIHAMVALTTRRRAAATDRRNRRELGSVEARVMAFLC